VLGLTSEARLFFCTRYGIGKLCANRYFCEAGPVQDDVMIKVIEVDGRMGSYGFTWTVPQGRARGTNFLVASGSSKQTPSYLILNAETDFSKFKEPLN
jgi:hypothetical protein